MNARLKRRDFAFKIGDNVRPTPEWRDAITPQIPWGKIKDASPFGEGQVLRVGDDPRWYIAGCFEIVEPEPDKMARTGDPDTSRQAAAGIAGQLTEIQSLVLAYIRSCGPAGTTAFEVEAHFNDHGATFRTRIAELCGVGAEGVAVNPPLVVKTRRRKQIEGTNRVVVVAVEFDGEKIDGKPANKG